MMCKEHKNRKCYLHLVIDTCTCSSSKLLLILVSCYLIQQMVEVMERSGVYWYPHQRAHRSVFKNWAGYINAAIDIFFTKETSAVSCTKGNAKKKAKMGTILWIPLSLKPSLVGCATSFLF